MVTEIKIVKNKNGVDRSFIFEKGEVKTQGIPQVSQEASLTIPKDDPSDTTEDFTINLGVTKDLDLTWILYKEDNDRAEGTYTSLVQTFEEMLNYLEDVICFPGVGIVNYTITITDKFRTRTAVYSLDSFNLDVDSKLHPTGTLKFKWKKQVI